MKSDFFAVMSRMKYINRWGLMRNTRAENLSEHSLDTALFAHAMVVIHNKKFGGNLNPERAGMLALFHDASEIITGDMPTPIKYFNPEIRKAYAEAENSAKEKLISLLPDFMREEYAPLIKEEGEEYLPFIKAADKISALVKCIEEKTMGNGEFADAEKSLKKAVKELNLPEANEFVSIFLDSFSKTLDSQGK